MLLAADQTAAITGAGSGIGRALALACAERGLSLALADIDPERLAETAELVRSAIGDAERDTASSTPLSTHVVDVTDARRVERFAADTIEQHGACHVLFNNAGVLILGAIEDATPRDWDWVLDINLRGIIHGVDAFLPHFLARGRDAHIVNTVSLRGIAATIGSAVYCTSKFAALGLTEALEKDLEGRGVGVTAVCPWAVHTELMERQEERPEGVSRIPAEYVEALTRAAGGDEPGLWMSPEQVAALTLEGIEADELYVITHPLCRSLVAERAERMLASIDRLAARHPNLPR